MSIESRAEVSQTELVTKAKHESTGVTYHFAEPVQVGRYWNGDLFVVSNGNDIVIEKIDPSSSPEGNGRVMNGAAIQPGRDSGFDSADHGKFMHYDDALNRDPGNTGASLVIPFDKYPSGASVVKAVSLKDLGNSRDKSSIEKFSILTIVDEVPPEGAFRPPVLGTDKTSKYTIGDLDFGKLQKLDKISGQPDIDSFDYLKNAAYVSWTTTSEGARNLHPNAYHEGYGDYQMDALVEAFMALHNDYPDSQKRDLYASFVQTGIDYAGAVADGKAWSPDGGHNNHVKPFVVLAAAALNSRELADLASASTRAYSEDGQFIYVDDDMVGRENFNFVGNKNPQFGNVYQEMQLGMPEWIVSPGRETPALNASYRMHNSDNVPIVALVMEMLGDGEGREIWGDDAYFDYAHRVQHIFETEAAYTRGDPHWPREVWSDFVHAYSDDFRSTPVWFGPPEAPHQVAAEINGAGLSVTLGGPVFDGGREVTRVDFRYSADGEDWTTLHDVSDSFAVTNLPENGLIYFQARYVNSLGAGPWTANTIRGDNYGLVEAMIDVGLVNSSDVRELGIKPFIKSDDYQDSLRTLLDGATSKAEAKLIDDLVYNTVIVGEGLSLVSGALSVDENVPVGTVVGSLPRQTLEGRAIEYEIVGGSDYFRLDGADVVSARELDHEEASEHTLVLRETERADGEESTLKFWVQDVEEPTVDFWLDIPVIHRDTEVGSVVGRFSAYDDDDARIDFRSNSNWKFDHDVFEKFFDIEDDVLVLAEPLANAPSSIDVQFYTSSGGTSGNHSRFSILITDEGESRDKDDRDDRNDDDGNGTGDSGGSTPTVPETGTGDNLHPVVGFGIDIPRIDRDTDVGTVVGGFSARDDDGTTILFRSNSNSKFDDDVFSRYFDIVGDKLVLTEPLSDAPSVMDLQFYTRSGGSSSNHARYSIEIEGSSDGDNRVTPVTGFDVRVPLVDRATKVGSVVGEFSANGGSGEIMFRSNSNPKFDDAIFDLYFKIVDDKLILTGELDDAPSRLDLQFYTSSGGDNSNHSRSSIEISEPIETASFDAIVDEFALA